MRFKILSAAMGMLLSVGCSPVEPMQTEAQATAPLPAPASSRPAPPQAPIEKPNVFLTVIYDEDEALPKRDELTILIDGTGMQGVAVANTINFYLAPGRYDVQISSIKRKAARIDIIVTEEAGFEQTVFLKSEGLALLGDYKIDTIGLGADKVVDLKQGLSIGVFDSNGNLLPFDHISMIRLAQIEPGSFVEGVGGREISRGQLVHHMFSINGTFANLSDSDDLRELSKKLELGDYEIEASLYDSVNDKSYESPAFFRVSAKLQ